MIVRYEIDDDNNNDYEIMEAKLMIIMVVNEKLMMMVWDNGHEINDDDGYSDEYKAMMMEWIQS